MSQIPPTLRELIDSTRNLAESLLDQTAAINRLIPIQERLQHDVHTLLMNHDLDRADLYMQLSNLKADLGRVCERLQIASEGLKDASDDIKDVHREVTNPRFILPTALPPPPTPEEEKHAISSAFKAFDKLSPTSKVLVVVIFTLLCASGWIHSVLSSVLSKTH